MTYPLVLDLAADGVPVAVTCRVLGFSKQGFYAWRANPVTDRDWADAHLVNAAIEIHHDDPEFSYRFIADKLAEVGIPASRNRVARLCSAHRIVSVIHRRRGSGKTPGPAVHDDLVCRDFTATAPNQLWLTDITEHPTAEGKIYPCAIRIQNSRSTSRRSDGAPGDFIGDLPVNSFIHPAGLPINTSEIKVLRRPVESAQFRSRKFVRALAANGLVGSMGRVGAAGD